MTMSVTETSGEVERATLADLQRTFLFEDFTSEQLAWVIDHSSVRWLEAGEFAVRQDIPVDDFWVLLDGQVRFARTVRGQDVVLDLAVRPGSWGGWLPIFENVPTVSVQALQPSKMLRIPKEHFQYMLDHGFPMTNHLLIGLYGGIQDIEAVTRHQEKMAALGKLAAGLAHELNNPASAAGRAAVQLRELLSAQETRSLHLGSQLNQDDADWLLELLHNAIGRAARLEPLDPMTKSDRTDQLLDWFDAHGIEGGWDLAPDLVSAGIATSDLDAIEERLPRTATANAVSWLCLSVSAAALTDEVEISAGRISELVQAIKDYSYMDQAPIQNVDIHAGIEDTLKIFGYKLKKAGIEVVRDYDRSLPRITAYGSELNQVWTNLIANAVDALAPRGNGRITIRTSREGDSVVVEIVDDGPGIPREIRSRIWEPFFTTKGVGVGSGMGLDSARRIVVARHRGEIGVTSQPGDTRFRVSLPIDQPASGRSG
jgi:signal transduction histidine kinase